MSAAGGGPAGSAIKGEMLLALGVIGGLLGIFLVGFNPVLGPVLAALGGVCAIIWGADAIRRVASYGLGTGVPSIGYMSVSIGILGALTGIAFVTFPFLKGLEILGPVFALVFAMLLGLIVGVVAKKIVGMKIAILERCTAEISGAAALSVLGFSAALAGTYAIEGIFAAVIAPGFIALFFIMNTMAIQHPFNACLGPNENQVRTLKLAASTAFLAMFVTGLLAIVASANAWMGIPVWLAIILVGAIGWIISIRAYILASFKEAASVKWAGLWPKIEEQ
jgi:tetrahydromethanopterin S-methyltransferase subunit C